MILGYYFGAPLNKNIPLNTSIKHKISILTLASKFDYNHSKKTSLKKFGIWRKKVLIRSRLPNI